MNQCGKDMSAVDMSLDLSKAREMAESAKRLESDEENGNKIVLNLNLPDGSSKEYEIRQGYQVVYVKALLCEEFGYGMKEVSLWLNDEQMLDPMSLADYPNIQSDQLNQVIVKVTK
eukprot:TRINITY_DN2924_c0_g1_i3.p6 TRINITY_DN2924_c0_g1~~TRINITY_DN2924_c0_g1_i3.p6  ORF type:complete len:116 (-),score=16.03 TRINITY_DN2924_c0_g1_i3:808-1155(-)